MGLSVSAIAVSDRLECRGLRRLGPQHQLAPARLRMLERYFGLVSAAVHPAPHDQMCAEPVRKIVVSHGALAQCCGLLVYAKTQTHNTAADRDWLLRLAARVGLPGWDVMTISMSHCASGLGALHLLRATGETRPVILLTGEKCFHASTCTQRTAVMGESPVAVLLNAGAPAWRVRHTRLTHLPAYYANPDAMDRALQVEFDRNFGDYQQAFVTDTLAAFETTAAAIDAVVPYYLNQPLLRRIAAQHGWESRLHADAAARVGHLFCADVFHSLAGLLPSTYARRVFCFAAGMGASFAAILLERTLDHDC